MVQANRNRIELLHRISQVADDALVEKMLRWMREAETEAVSPDGDRVQGMDEGTQLLYLQAALEAEMDFLEGRVHSQEEVEAWLRGKIGDGKA